ncbi:hypothetical protein [Thermococcus barophilus]|uniref:Uncharacterized protein n=1 Tax=Thermococcus barophilus TaxID=55802 RepID=A0A0S1XEE2_THEBA|nr:hypothetical protein [Thermococcus barophilus]ALM76083.1 hypothetical protein TBCH5v1_2184 [Thermococcus barophilus]
MRRQRIEVAFGVFLVIFVVTLLYVTSPRLRENYLVSVEAQFSSEDVKFLGAELLEGYPNPVTNVAIFKFERSLDTIRDKVLQRISVEMAFDVPPDFVIGEIWIGNLTLYCPARWSGKASGSYILRDWDQNCAENLTEVLKHRILVEGCLNVEYLGFDVSDDYVVRLVFNSTNATNCFKVNAEVFGRPYGITVLILYPNGTLICPVIPVDVDEYHEILKISEDECKWDEFW